ncbi:MAG: hypothetical protein ABL904_03080 [Hyphomicrobiaceae bacterium]
MPVNPFIPWLLAAFVPAVIGQVIGARIGSPWISGAAAMFLPIMSIVVALKVNSPYWQRATAPSGIQAIADASRRNARLIAWTWAAGAVSMLAVYRFSGLRWQHGWQYGSGMVLIASLIFIYALSIESPSSPLRRPRLLNAVALMAAAQGIAGTAGIMMLVISGKLGSMKGDWAANIIFVAGGFAIMVLSAIAVRTHARLSLCDRDGRQVS